MRKAVTAYLVLVNTLVLILVLELSAQLSYRVIFDHWVFSPDPGRMVRHQAMERHPYLVQRLRPGRSTTRGSVAVTATEGATRWTGADYPPDPDRFVVATVGGSTTFGTLVSDEDTWPALLQERLGDEYAVVNFGMPGFSTAEAIIQMGFLVPEVDPDVVVLYQGWNDIHNYHDPDFSPDHYRHGMMRLEEISRAWGPGVVGRRLDERGFVHRAADYSALMRLISRTSVAISPWQEADTATLHSTPDTAVDRIYLRNLRTLRAMAEDLGAHALFVPQVIHEERWRQREGSEAWTRWIRSHQMPELMRRFNRIMGAACAADDPDCSVAVEVLEVEWAGPDFVDLGHLSRRGGERIATILAERILQLGRSAPSNSPES